MMIKYKNKVKRIATILPSATSTDMKGALSSVFVKLPGEMPSIFYDIPCYLG